MKFTILQTMTSEDPHPNASEHFIQTRDGEQLATDVYLPSQASANGKHPAVMVRTPYDKSSRYTALKHEAEYFNSRGYAYVAQDVRGKFRSSGETDPYTFDVDDGYDTAQWISEQSWSDGTIGVVGASYYGFTTWAAVASGHPAIRAAVPQVTGINMGARHVASRWMQEVPAFVSINDLVQIWTNNEDYLAEFGWDEYSVTEVLDAAKRAIGESSGVRKLLERSRTQEWYNPYQDRHPYFTTGIPILHWQNWYDPGLAPAGLKDWRHFMTLSAQSNLHFLRVGSADHSGFKLEHVGKGSEHDPYRSDEALAAKIAEECGEMADFFDEHVRGIPPENARVRARWHIGHWGWQETPEYPPAADPRTFYLGVNGALASEAAGAPGYRSWVHDPENPVPSSVSIEAVWFYLAEYPDERDLDGRPDVLTFTSPELESALTIAGQARLDFTLEFDAPSTHLFVRLQDVHPDGTTRPIAWGRTVITEKMMDHPISLALDDNAYMFREGHRVQVQVCSSDAPHYLVHPGTDENPWFASERRTVEHRIHLGGASGAALTLPTIVPAPPRDIRRAR